MVLIVPLKLKSHVTAQQLRDAKKLMAVLVFLSGWLHSEHDCGDGGQVLGALAGNACGIVPRVTTLRLAAEEEAAASLRAIVCLRAMSPAFSEKIDQHSSEQLTAADGLPPSQPVAKGSEG